MLKTVTNERDELSLSSQQQQIQMQSQDSRTQEITA